MVSDHPIYDNVRLDTGIDPDDLKRPAWEPPAYDVDKAWTGVEMRFTGHRRAYERGVAREDPTDVPARQPRKPRTKK